MKRTGNLTSIRAQSQGTGATAALPWLYLVLSLLGGCQHIAPTPVAAQHPTPLDAVRAGIERQLNREVTLQIDTYRQDGEWAYVTGRPLTEQGARIDYTDTVYAQDIREGYFDDGFVALARKPRPEVDDWTLEALSLGATDAPFVDWPKQFGVPRDLIVPPTR